MYLMTCGSISCKDSVRACFQTARLFLDQHPQNLYSILPFPTLLSLTPVICQTTSLFSLIFLVTWLFVNTTKTIYPLRSSCITSLLHYYRVIRPCALPRYSHPYGSTLGFLPYHQGDRFPRSMQKPVLESRHLYTGRHPDSLQVSSGFIPQSDFLRF